MRDNDLRTAWVEGVKGSGVGEAITLEPKEAYLTEVGILNGFVSNKALYYANARIKKLRLEIDHKEDAEGKEQRETREILLPDRRYEDFNPRYPFSSVDWIEQHPQGGAFIERVTLTILEVYPGRKYQDTAVTELYLCGFAR